jgi:carboxymethylenebutenolidase
MQASTLSISSHDGKTFDGYLSLPPTGSGPGLLLIQEIWGVNAHIRAVADQYAMDGYVVLAPDVFWRQRPSVDLQYTEADTALAYQYMKNLDVPDTVLDLQSAAQALRAQASVSGNALVSGKLASLGFCLGGRLSYALAATGAVDAAVCYYGGRIQENLALAPRIQVPMLFHYAELDDHIPPSAVSAVQQAFAYHNHPSNSAQFHVYPGVGHGFNCWGRALYNQRAAALARGRTLQWLASL